MQPARGRRATRRRRTFGLPALAFVLGIVALAGCIAGCEQVKTLLPGSRPLVTITARGGLCANGPCGDSWTVDPDGLVRAAVKPPNELGRVSPDDLAALQRAIASADWVAIKGHPFTGQCPVAFDGQELVLEFATDHGIERIASCEVAIDWRTPPFDELGAAVSQWVPLPRA
jgi:hypothetical protein